jgi:hypothetical protein
MSISLSIVNYAAKTARHTFTSGATLTSVSVPVPSQVYLRELILISGTLPGTTLKLYGMAPSQYGTREDWDDALPLCWLADLGSVPFNGETKTGFRTQDVIGLPVGQLNGRPDGKPVPYSSRPGLCIPLSDTAMADVSLIFRLVYTL